MVTIDSMMVGTSAGRLRELNDPALWPLIDAADEASRETAIETLVTGTLKPIIAEVLRRFRASEPGLRLEDLEELSSMVVLRMIRKLRGAAYFEEHAIGSLDGYVVTLTYRALHDFRRDRYPARYRLKKRLRYLCARDSRLATWNTPGGTAAGLSGWKGRTDVRMWASIDGHARTVAMANRSDPAGAVAAILEQIGGPVAFDALVDAVVDIWNVREVVLENADSSPDIRQDQLSSLEQRQYLEKLWSEIRALPELQRAALLLNLRDTAGGNAVALFLLLQIASVAEVAEAARMSNEELDAVWEKLPLDDLAIAARLGRTRQQIINLRKAARLRLRRRMSAWES